MAKVLLISPPFMRFMEYTRFYYPMGLASIAAVLEKHGHEVLIYDADHCNDGSMLKPQELMKNYNHYIEGIGNQSHPIWKEIKEIFVSYKPDFIGISVYTDVLLISKKVIELARAICSDANIIVGGPHVTLCPEDFQSLADYIVQYEGEYVILDIVEGRASKGTISGDRIFELDELPFPAIDKLYKLDTYTKRDLSIIISSRGCPNKCKFCNSYNLWDCKTVRKSPNYLIQEILNLKNSHGITDFYITDDIFTYNGAWLGDFCNAAKQLDITWRCLSHINYIDRGRVKIMKDSGCRNIKFGIESGSQTILDRIDKHIQIENVMEISRMLLEEDMDWSAFFIIGFPGETVDDIRQTQQLIKSISAKSVTVNIYTPLPHNRLGDYKGNDFGKHSFHSLYNNFTGCIEDDIFCKLVAETLSLAETNYNEHFVHL